MSTATLLLITRQVNIYLGLYVAITGLFGQVCNLIIFTTLKTFRETTCGVYLTGVSVANLGQAFTVLIRCINVAYISLSSSGIFCKLRYFLSQYFSLVSLTCVCLTTIDQFLSMTKYRHLNSMKSARRHIIAVFILWFIHGIFTFIYYDSNQSICVMTNTIFAQYYSYFYLLVFYGVLPLSTMIIFSLLGFFKARTVASRQTNIVRLSRDRQLTAMTLFHVVFIVFGCIPFVAFFAYTLLTTAQSPEESARNQLILAFVTLLCYDTFAIPFYIYCCVSKRFRKQFVYVLIGIHLKRWRRRITNLNNNQVIPNTEIHGQNQQDLDIISIHNEAN